MIHSFKIEELSIAKLHQLLLGSVAPRPIALASTMDKYGHPNLSPYSFYNVFGVNPTTLIFSPSRRVRDKSAKHTFENVKEVPEVVINAVSYEMVNQVSLSSTEYPKGVDEFIKAGLTKEKSLMVKPFRVKESPVQFECKVREVIETSQEGGAGNLVICEILTIHVNDAVLAADGLIDQNKIRLVGRMGRDIYIKAFGESLFEVEKPLQKIGIGIDMLPQEVRFSNVLSGNDLGRLGNIERLPSAEEVQEALTREDVKNCLNSQYPKRELQLLAKELIARDEVWEALKVLMI